MINPQDFIHPEDEADRRNMEAIPGFAAAVKALLRLAFEQYYQRLMYNIKLQDSGTKCFNCHQHIDEKWTFCKFCGSKN